MRFPHAYPETLQEVFETAVRGLAQQEWKKASWVGRCQYRTEEGLACGIGQCIPDAHYFDGFEDRGVSDLIDAQWVPDSWRDFLRALEDIQAAHDQSDSPQDMRRRLQLVGEERGLEWPKEIQRTTA